MKDLPVMQSQKTERHLQERSLGKTKLMLRLPQQVCRDLSFPQSYSYSKFAWFNFLSTSLFSHSATTNSYSTTANSLQDQIWQLTGPDRNPSLGSRSTSTERWYWSNYPSHCRPVPWGYNNQHGDTQAVDPGSGHACEVGHSYQSAKGHYYVQGQQLLIQQNGGTHHEEEYNWACARLQIST